MAIVINGSGTVTGLAVGGLPDGTVDDGTVASGITSSKLTGALPAISGASLTGITADNNTPSLRVRLSGNQSFSSGTWTKINWNTEDWDTDSAFASSKFTVPSNEAGKYLIAWNVAISGAADNEYATCVVYKNGNIDTTTRSAVGGSQNFGEYYTGNTVALNLAVNDYIELYGLSISGGNFLADRSSFFITKLAGV